MSIIIIIVNKTSHYRVKDKLTLQSLDVVMFAWQSKTGFVITLHL